MAAKRGDWKTTPLPGARQALPIERTYSRREFERVIEGKVPEQMEDKWFAFYEEPWFYHHRSWTGYCIFQERFERTARGARIVEAWVNRDPEQYRSTDARCDVLLLSLLLDRYAGRPIEELREQYSRCRSSRSAR